MKGSERHNKSHDDGPERTSEAAAHDQIPAVKATVKSALELRRSVFHRIVKGHDLP